jgi:flavin reductase (DIM6/NTAB) family NADH-FMN oxidoreductase RutF/rubredoxin
MNPKALQQISYGMYILTSGKDGKLNGQIANAVLQATADPVTVAVCVSHENLTHEFIEHSKVFTLSVLSEDAPMNLIAGFGYRSGRDHDKFQGVSFREGRNGAPIVLDSTVAFLECELIDQMDLGSHTMFAGRLIDGDLLSDKDPMTYAYYHTVKGGKSPKNAPSYVHEESSTAEEGVGKMIRYVCSVCGYVYDPEKGDPNAGIEPGTSFQDLPDGWVCPVCGAAKGKFEKEGA